MNHTSVLKLNSPIEFIESTKISPFISKVLIKVCYVGDEPNRNHSIITKDVAKEMAPSLRGCPIVGFFNETAQDYEEHNQQITLSGGKWTLTDNTTPYGFVDLNAKIWFATYIDDGQIERTYLCTEGYIWDNAYPEAKRILEKGNNQSMELDEKTLNANWSKDENGKPQFFIINEAFLSKLCILGENYEPCFEGSQITAFSLVIDNSFQEKMYSMMSEIKELLTTGGGTKVFNKYTVDIGDALWSALYNYIETTYPDEQDIWRSKYSIDGIFEEEGGQKFVVLHDRANMKYYRLNFSLSDSDGLQVGTELIEVTKDYQPIAGTQFSEADIETYISEYIKKKEEEKNKDEDKNDEENKKESDKSSEEDKKKKFSYDSLEEIPEYVDLQTKFSELSTQVANLNATIESLTNEIEPLRDFKASAIRKEKEAMIAKFYMLSDEDKKDVIDNINTYSLDDIEAKLSILCVRNKVSFSEDDNQGPTTYTLEAGYEEDSSLPAWVKAALETEKTLKE